MNFHPLTLDNLTQAVTTARQIFPHAGSADCFRPEATYRRSLQHPEDRMQHYLAQDGDSLVGVCGHYPDWNAPQRLWLGWFGVLPEQRRKGYGARILQHMQNLTRQMGATELRLYSSVLDQPAHRLYRRLGFELLGEGQVEGEPVLYFRIPLST